MSVSPNMESSVIIPVFNQWNFTSTCLATLAETVAGKSVEVIVIDNASTDATGEECPELGQRLFGSRFRYQRCAQNCNFGPASNMGARMAVGEYLVFLNNDTELLPGWYEPLIADFAAFPDIAATGPVLLYPAREPFGHTVQHLGVFVSPTFKVGHLYEGIPAASPLVNRRRFFQIITAACMVMRRSLFLEAGLFDEHYINGFEDVDLCARLFAQGRRMTVNPASRVIHHTSRTPGRHAHEQENSDYFVDHTRNLLTPDWHIHCRNDGMVLRVSPWQTWQGALPSALQRRLDAAAARASFADLRDLLEQHPLWEAGWHALIEKAESPELCAELRTVLRKLYYGPDVALPLYADSCRSRDRRTAEAALADLVSFCKPWGEYLGAAKSMLEWSREIGMEDFASQYAEWLFRAEDFRQTQYEPFLEKFWEMARHWSLPPLSNWAYTLWLHNVDTPRRRAMPPSTAPDGPAFSILMPVYNPRPEHLAAALDSVLAQDCPRWELCVADDASTDPAVRPLLEDYMHRDGRIRVTWRAENEHIAAAANTALGMARHPWAALMDQDDLLAPDALSRMSDALARHPDALLLYSDEDKVNDEGSFFHPHFKNGKWDAELLLANDIVSRFSVFNAARLRDIGGFRKGFPGSQCFDMVLQFTHGQPPSCFVHTPHVLYHRRVHGGSASLTVNAKKEIVESARKAVQARLDAEGGGAASVLPSSQYVRPQFALPSPPPQVSLILDMTGEHALALLEASYTALTARTAYPAFEMLVLYNDAASLSQRARARRLAAADSRLALQLVPPGASGPERLRLGAAKAGGAVLGFMASGLVPLTEGWLEELVAALCREHVGTVGGKLVARDNTTLHGGYLTDARGELRPLLCGLPRNEPGWFAWNVLARTVDALDALCLFTRRETWDVFGGFDPGMGEAAAQDYCLRLGRQRLRSVWWPYAEFVAIGQDAVQPVGENTAFAERWKGRLTPANPNLVANGDGWSLMADESGWNAHQIEQSNNKNVGEKKLASGATGF
ncbi:MAG: glycosyltransferase [Desulfovibrio desulfuricans]|nr:glycosyltransferase [Desulfovibrio desulfuricans]